MKRTIIISHRGTEARRGSPRALFSETTYARRQFLCASVPLCALLASLALLLASTASSFSALSAAEPLPIGLINVDRILKTHKPLQEKLDPLKDEAKDLDAKVQVRQAELEGVGAQLRTAQPGTPDHQRLQLQFVKLQTDLQQFVATERQSLQKKEATIYLAFFRQLDAEIAKYAKAHGLKLVIRQHESSLEEGQSLPDIYKALNRGILYEDGLDITDEILKALNNPPPSAGVQR